MGQNFFGSPLARNMVMQASELKKHVERGVFSTCLKPRRVPYHSPGLVGWGGHWVCECPLSLFNNQQLFSESQHLLSLPIFLEVEAVPAVFFEHRVHGAQHDFIIVRSPLSEFPLQSLRCPLLRPSARSAESLCIFESGQILFCPEAGVQVEEKFHPRSRNGRRRRALNSSDALENGCQFLVLDKHEPITE